MTLPREPLLRPWPGRRPHAPAGPRLAKWHEPDQGVVPGSRHRRDLVQPPRADPSRSAGGHRRRRRVGCVHQDPHQRPDVGGHQAHGRSGDVGHRHQHRRRHDHCLGAGPRPVRRQADPGCHHRHPVRVADDRRRSGAAVALRKAEPARRRLGEHRDGGHARAGVRDSAVRRADRAAGPRGARPRRRGGRGILGRQSVDDLPADHRCRAWLRRSQRVPRSRSLGRSPSTARWCSFPETFPSAPRSCRYGCSPSSKAATPRRLRHWPP